MAVVRRAFTPVPWRAVDNRPAGDERENPPDSLNAYLLDIDGVTDTTQAIDVAFGVPPLSGCVFLRDDQSTPIVHSQRVNRYAEDARSRPDRVERSVRVVCHRHATVTEDVSIGCPAAICTRR